MNLVQAEDKGITIKLLQMYMGNGWSVLLLTSMNWTKFPQGEARGVLEQHCLNRKRIEQEAGVGKRFKSIL